MTDAKVTSERSRAQSRKPGKRRRRSPSYWRHHEAQQRAKKFVVPQQVEPVCLECGNLGKLVKGDKVYPDWPHLHVKSFYLCDCGAYVGCHPGSDHALGYPAAKPTQRARSKAHRSFDRLWEAKAVLEGISRNEARRLGYEWLADQMGLPRGRCHIGWMDLASAQKVHEICKAIRIGGKTSE